MFHHLLVYPRHTCAFEVITILVVTDSVDGLKWGLNAASDCEMLGLNTRTRTSSSHIEEGMTTVAQPPKKGYRTIRLPLAESEYDRFLTDRSYTYCMPLRCVTQPIFVAIASNHHPVSKCPVEEAKRWHGRGHNGERRC
jgi:hypothetical protein